MENLKGVMFLIIFICFVMYAKKYDNKRREADKMKDSIEYYNDTLNKVIKDSLVIKH